MLEAVGLPELVVPDLEAYERRAVDLANNPDLLCALRSRLAERRRTWPLFDTPRFVRNLESAYLTMWARHQAGEPPDMLAVRAESGES